MSSTKEGNAVIARSEEEEEEDGGDRCLERPWEGREGVMGLLLINGWASSSVGRHSE